jgi:hypothetical protein
LPEKAMAAVGSFAVSDNAAFNLNHHHSQTADDQEVTLASHLFFVVIRRNPQTVLYHEVFLGKGLISQQLVRFPSRRITAPG